MDNQLTFLRTGIQASIAVKQSVLQDDLLLRSVLDVAILMHSALSGGHRIIFAGNGGSAADAQHLAAEFVSRFDFDRPGLPALSLATDTSMMTAIGNDYGFEKLFARQLQAQSRAGDVFVGITTSGRSPNILAAFDVCGAMGVASVALCGTAGILESTVDHVIRVPSAHTPRIQECHIVLGHLMCEYVETQMFGHLKPK